MGIKGASILSSHLPFDMCAGVEIDMMHCVFLGVIGKSFGLVQVIMPNHSALKKGMVDMFL